MEKVGEFSARCHCGRVRCRFRCNTSKIVVWDCNCSDCFMRRNVHLIIPKDDFAMDMTEESYQDATILYQWGTKKAVRRFCRTCGILPWYQPRSNPDGIAITINCVDWGNFPPHIKVEHFDGVHWEDTMTAMSDDSKKVNILSMSKKANED